MREIKFRVWNSKKHNMSYFDLGKNKPIEDVVFGLMLASQKGNGILMQFTGLHDKNGEEIYEGDILSIAYDQICIGQVIFTDGGFKTTEMDANYRLDQKSILNDESEIIGNIYENADLLRSE